MKLGFSEKLNGSSGKHRHTYTHMHFQEATDIYKRLLLENREFLALNVLKDVYLSCGRPSWPKHEHLDTHAKSLKGAACSMLPQMHIVPSCLNVFPTRSSVLLPPSTFLPALGYVM
eukprot:1161843-Pelagomonas_calceolata.AAC.10